MLAAAAATAVALTAAACASSPTTLTTASKAPSLAGKRYCEVLLVHHGRSGFTADVYNTYPLNSCPEAQWSRLDASRIASENGAVFADLNGPRYWLMNSIEKVRTGREAVKTFGGIAMIKEATVTVGPTIASALVPFVAHTVDRQASFTFNAGRQVYELVDPAGRVWVMQTYSQIKDPTLSQADLPGLAARLTLPAGWTYRVRTLTAPLVVATANRPAQVLQDNLDNSYSLVGGG